METAHFGRTIVAFVAGLWLYQAIVVIAGGYFAAIAIPSSYFEFFGREHSAFALTLVRLVTFALPVAVLIAGGTLAAARLLGARRRTFALVLLGMVFCCAFWIAITVLGVQDLGIDVSSFLKQLLTPRWWDVPAIVAPWVGFGFAVWVSRRRASSEV